MTNRKLSVRLRVDATSVVDVPVCVGVADEEGLDGELGGVEVVDSSINM